MDEFIQLVNDADPRLWGEGKPRHVGAGAVVLASLKALYGVGYAFSGRKREAWLSP